MNQNKLHLWMFIILLILFLIFFLFEYGRAMRVKGDWKFRGDYPYDWRFQKEEVVTVPTFARLYKDGTFFRRFENGEHNRLFRRETKDAWKLR